ncbi:hypothetical protein [Stakelama marina]|uniref:Lipoprotein n=1 Tax=Stakelama marina TaxID=2826939 RepID=A0A8T4IHU4_9SPHN|nr:hypothetical protein [Stakelama marina]MBR0553444.1 hypothetical protein [Stakelama marina]
MRTILVLAALSTALAGCAMSPEQVAVQKREQAKEFASTLDNRVPTKTEDCINSSLVTGPQIIGNDTIIYRESGRRLWVSKIEACPALRPLTTLIVEQYGTQLCRHDRFRVLEPGATIPSAYCTFGTFTAYDRPDAKGG